MSPKFKAILLRFAKAFLSGAFSMAATAVVAINSVSTWNGLQSALSVLALASVIGGITGLVMAGEKYFNWTDTPPTV